MKAIKSTYRKLECGRINPARKYRCRCSKCEHRQTFRGLPWLKAKAPECPACGSREWRVDWFRQMTETTRSRCDCGGYWFPHRAGSCNKRMENAR